jgi:hypothetical protein
MRAIAVLLFSSLVAFSWSEPGFAAGGQGGGGGHGGGGGGGHGGGGGARGGGGHFGGGGHGGYGGYRGGYGGHGGYGGRGGYGYHGGYGGWGWGGVGLGLGLYYATLPFYYSTYWGADGSPYYYGDDNYYQWDGNANEYETVSPPPEVQRQAANQSPDLMAYPKNGQSDAQQATDKTECHTWAAAQSGFDPTQSVPAHESTNGSSNKRSDYMRAQAACFEARGYSVK